MKPFMQAVASDSAMPADSLEDVLHRVRALAPQIRAAALQTENDRRVSTELMSALRETGALDLMRPHRFGGLELGPHALIRLGLEIGRSCGSTAWCASLSNCNAWFASFWPVETQAAIWGQNPDALVAGVAAPTGRVERVPNGYAISGAFPFASNCDNSEWIFVSAIVPADADEPAHTAWFMLPLAELTIDQSSWHVTGMQGTGSKTVRAAEPVFVPQARVIFYDDVVAGTTPGALLPGSTVARYGYSTFGAAALVGPMLGMAQGALDWFVETMKSKVRLSLRPGAPIPAGASPLIQARIGAASAMIDAAVALLLHDLQPAEAHAERGGTLDDETRVRIRRNFGFAAQQAIAATNLVAEAAGGSASAVDVPIQRFWRDVNAAGRHVSLDTQGINAMVGQERLGLPLMGSF